MNWKELISIDEYKKLVNENSLQKDQTAIVLFKHSTRCAISSLAKRRLESDWLKINSNIPIYLIDLIKNRDLSNFIASSLNVEHQSPQLIIVGEGKPKYHASHLSISSKDAAKHM